MQVGKVYSKIKSSCNTTKNVAKSGWYRGNEVADYIGASKIQKVKISSIFTYKSLKRSGDLLKIASIGAFMLPGGIIIGPTVYGIGRTAQKTNISNLKNNFGNILQKAIKLLKK